MLIVMSLSRIPGGLFIIRPPLLPPAASQEMESEHFSRVFSKGVNKILQSNYSMFFKELLKNILIHCHKYVFKVKDACYKTLH